MMSAASPAAMWVPFCLKGYIPVSIPKREGVLVAAQAWALKRTPRSARASVWGGNACSTVAGEVAVAKVVGIDEYNVGLL